MRTNKACPNYSTLMQPPSLNVAMTEEQEEIEKQLLNAEDDEDLVNVDGTKVKLSGKLLKVNLRFFFFFSKSTCTIY